MTLTEFDAIRQYLPDDTELLIVKPKKRSNAPRRTLIEEHWGNHDGRYNMKCIQCGWSSEDIFPGQFPPSVCPVCQGHGKEADGGNPVED